MRFANFLAPLALFVAIACVRGQTNPAGVDGGEMAPPRQQPVSLTLDLAMSDYAAGHVEGTTALVGAIAISPEMTAAGKILGYGGFGGGGGGGLGGGGDRQYPSVIVPLIEGVDASLTSENVSRDKFTLTFMIIQPNAKGKELLDAAAKRIVAALVEQPPLSQDELAKRMKDVGAQLAVLEDKLSLLRTMASNNATIGPEILKERIKSAELERQRLEMDLVAQKARSQAIAKQIDRVRQEVDEKLGSDTVLQQLGEVARLRDEEVARVKQLIEQGAAGKSDLSAAQEKLMQAKIRVAEREELLRQTSKTSLLERLNDELATIMINQAEMEVRLALIREQQPSTDLNAIDEEKLNRLAEQYRALFRNPGALPPLYFELDKKLNDLKRERLALQVTDVKVTAPAPEKPGP